MAIYVWKIFRCVLKFPVIRVVREQMDLMASLRTSANSESDHGFSDGRVLQSWCNLSTSVALY
jgi:hypothetical protein